ncbi:MAG: 3-methyl-2-oxobutanoate hydroxymethyltransferase [Candidatus Margulisbacteria bacterium GWF2_35_9]|nr:MAG: 3-methyl-2-oxobutanoate hydroxymethyltransferase [Candidatus Margulisbacteria bacterium GWF2_35_9]
MITIRTLQEKKIKKEKIVSLTAYDYTTAKALDESGIDMILVGDSLGMVVYGYDSTVKVTMDDMKRHTVAVVNGVSNALVISDMPFTSYHISIEDSIINARDLVRSGARGVKVEGATPFIIDVIKRMNEAGILVVGHLGFTPQQVNRLGGNIIQGRDKKIADKIKADSILLQSAGVELLVLEMVPEILAKEITDSLSIPTIGIGAGRYCDGQILVSHDLLGLYTNFKPKFVKRYSNMYANIKKSVKKYSKEVKSLIFPSEENIY